MTRLTFTVVLLAITIISHVSAYFPANQEKREALRRQFSIGGGGGGGGGGNGGTNLTGINGVENYVNAGAGAVVGTYLVASSLDSSSCNANFTTGTISNISSPSTSFCYCTPGSPSNSTSGIGAGGTGGTTGGIGNGSGLGSGVGAGAGAGVGVGSGTNNGSACDTCPLGFDTTCNSGICGCNCASGALDDNGACIVPTTSTSSTISTSTTTTTSSSRSRSITTRRNLVTTPTPPANHLGTITPNSSTPPSTTSPTITTPPTQLIGTPTPLNMVPGLSRIPPIIPPTSTLSSSTNHLSIYLVAIFSPTLIFCFLV